MDQNNDSKNYKILYELNNHENLWDLTEDLLKRKDTEKKD